jgi:hypothetical protein
VWDMSGKCEDNFGEMQNGKDCKKVALITGITGQVCHRLLCLCRSQANIRLTSKVCNV